MERMRRALFCSRVAKYSCVCRWFESHRVPCVRWKLWFVGGIQKDVVDESNGEGEDMRYGG
jgi:hypothetical protein